MRSSETWEWASPDGRRRRVTSTDGVPPERMALALGWTLDPPSAPQIERPSRAWSWSALSSAETCGRRYHAVRVGKVVAEEPAQALIDGAAVHAALARAIRREAAVPYNLAWLEPFVTKLSGMPNIKTEYPLAFTPDLTMTGRWAKDCWLSMHLDVFVHGDHALIVDWKTGRVKDNLDQLRLYASVLLLNEAPVSKVTATFVWLDAREMTSITMRQREAVDFMIDVRTRRLPVLREVERAKSWEDLPPVRSWMCRFCPLRACELNARDS